MPKKRVPRSRLVRRLADHLNRHSVAIYRVDNVPDFQVSKGAQPLQFYVWQDARVSITIGDSGVSTCVTTLSALRTLVDLAEKAVPSLEKD